MVRHLKKKKKRLPNRIQPGFSLGEMISRKKKKGGVCLTRGETAHVIVANC